MPILQETPTTNEDVVAALSSVQNPSTSSPVPDTTISSTAETVVVSNTVTPDLSSTAEALSSMEALQAATTEFTALASVDYSHLFSWGWPAGLFIRLFSLLQDFPLLATAPIACMAIGVLIARFPLSYFQLKGLKAQAAWAPYQNQFKTLSEEYKAAMASGNKLLAMEKAQELVKIREKTKFSPFTSLVPAFGLGYVGIGSFLGMGKLAAYQKEVVEMGGAGPLANPEGFLGSGWLTDLTAFDPGLWVLFTGLTWLNVRRSALDSPTYNPWLTRMPMLITPVFGVMSLLFRFSSAQMIVGAVSIGYTVIQSYLLRVPKLRYAAGMQGVKNQDPKTLKFPGFLESWREVGKWFTEQQNNVTQRTMMQQGPPIVSPGRPVSRDSLKIKDALPPPKIISHPYAASPPAPPPPKSMSKAKPVTAKAKEPQTMLPATLVKKQANANARRK